MDQVRITEFAGRPLPSPEDPGYKSYIPDHIEGLEPRERLVPSSEMSCVFLMYDTTRKSEVILKMPAGLRMARPQQAALIRHEIEILQKLDHPYAPQILDHGVDCYGVPYFTLRFIDGPGLHEIIHDGDLSWAHDERMGVVQQGGVSVRNAVQHTTVRLKLAIQLCDVAKELHQLGWIHRDIKPENAIYAKGYARLIDYGTAGPPKDSRFLAGTGTPPYAPLEQGRDGEQLSTDVYALGLVVFELIAGVRVPVHSSSVRRWVLGSLLRRRESPLLITIVLRCLREGPDRRYADAAELKRALERFSKCRQRFSFLLECLAAIVLVLAVVWELRLWFISVI